MSRYKVLTLCGLAALVFMSSCALSLGKETIDVELVLESPDFGGSSGPSDSRLITADVQYVEVSLDLGDDMGPVFTERVTLSEPVNHVRRGTIFLRDLEPGVRYYLNATGFKPSGQTEPYIISSGYTSFVAGEGAWAYSVSLLPYTSNVLSEGQYWNESFAPLTSDSVLWDIGEYSQVYTYYFEVYPYGLPYWVQDASGAILYAGDTDQTITLPASANNTSFYITFYNPTGEYEDFSVYGNYTD